VYTKKRGAHPDLTDPICLRTGATIEVPQNSGVSSFNSLNLRHRASAMEFTALWLLISDTLSSGNVPVAQILIVLTHNCALRVG
jgi:hypothetical protein